MIECKNCGRQFVEERHLAQHNRRKTPCDKQFKCDICNTYFPKQSLLKRHEKRKTPCTPKQISPLVSTTECQYCSSVLLTLSSKNRHEIRCLSNPNADRSKINDNTTDIPEASLVETRPIYIKSDSSYDTLLQEHIEVTSQWVYFIAETRTKYEIKIGLTNNLSTRLKALQTGNSSRLKIIAYIRTFDMYALETVFHQKLAKYRRIGEWFDMTVEQIYKVLANYREKGIIDVGILDNVKDPDESDDGPDSE
jgi:hypothetical protein